MKRLAYAAAFVMSAGFCAAGTIEDNMKAYAGTDLRAWLADPKVLAAVQAANVARVGLTLADIEALEATWQAEIGKDSALIKGVTESDTAAYLRAKVNASEGTVTEIIVMDALGLNVAASGITSDYWQGDEAKFQDTFGKGVDQVHLSEVDLDESTEAYQAQLSFTLTDPATGAAIGAVAVALNAEAF